MIKLAHRGFVSRTSLFVCLFAIFSLSSHAQYKFGGKCAVSFSASKQQLTDYKGGTYSSASQVREVEQKFQARAKNDLEINLTEGLLDTGVMRKSYEKTMGDLKYSFGTFRDLADVFPTLMIKESKVKAASGSGLFYTKIYGEDSLLDFKNLRNFVDEIPNSQFYLSHENLAKMHKIYGENMMAGVAKLGNALNAIGLEKASDLVWRGGGNYRITETRIWDHGVSSEAVQNIKLALDRLSAEGMPFENLSSADRSAFQIKFEHPYPIIRWFTLSGIRTRPDGKIDFMGSYPSAKIIEKGMNMIIDWTNKHLDKIRRGDNDAMDPIELAAVTQYAFVYLHPYKDGNGRIVKIIRDKILEVAGLPFDLRYADSLGRDLEKSLEDFIAEVRFGVFYSINRLNAIETRITKGYHSNVTPSAFDTKVGLVLGGHDTRQLSKQERKSISEKPFPADRSQVYTVGGGAAFVDGRFDPSYYVGRASVGEGREITILNRGSMVTDTSGIPYIYMPESNTLYPVNDWSLALYGQGGELFRKRTRSNMYNFRKPNASLRQAIDNTLIMLRGINIYSKNPSDPRAIDPKSIVVKSAKTSDINPAERSPFGDLVLQDFQSNLLVDMFSNRVDPKRFPEATLARYRGNQNSPNSSGPSQFQKFFNTNKPEMMELGDVAGAYQLSRAELIKLRQDVETMSPEVQERVLPLIMEARKDIYEAARAMLLDFPNLLKEIFTTKPGESRHPKLANYEENIQFHRQAREHDLWRALYAYAKNQEWYYETFEQAMKLDQNSMLVVRNIAEGFHLKIMGLATEKQQSFALRLIPGLPGLFKAIDAEIKASNKEKRKINPKNVDSIIGRWWIQNKANDYDKEGNPKKDGLSGSRKDHRAFVDKIVNGVLTEYYSTRGMDDAYARPFIDIYLHVVGFHPQVMKSTTVDPTYNWFLNGRSELKFFPGGSSFLYRVKIGKEAVDSKFSPYTAQYEVVENKWIDPVRMTWRVKYKATQKGLQLAKMDENGRPVRDSDNNLVLTDFGKRSMEILNGVVNLSSSRVMVPPETPTYNSRYELVDVLGNKVEQKNED